MHFTQAVCGIREQYSLERAQGMGGESQKLTCASTALDSKSEKKRCIFTSFARIQKKKKRINPPFDGGYKAPNHLVVWLHSHSRGDFFRFRSIVDFRMMAVPLRE